MLFVASFLLCLICTSCGVVGSGPASPPPVTVTVMPNSAQLFPGGNKQFNAVVENASNSAVNWQLSQPSGGNTDVGTISSSGYYTAPNSVTNQATVTVTAVLQTDPSASGSASITIQGKLSLSPLLTSVTTSETLQLNLLTAGVINTDVNWAVDGIANGSPTVGTLSTSVVPSNSIDYIPPPIAGSHTITATLMTNASVSGSAQVDVTDFPGTLTWRNDNSRSGVNRQELALNPATVSSSTFGKLFSCPADGPLDGYVYAQPLYVPNLLIPGNGMHNVVFVATENDSVYAFDADANPCKQLWQKSLIPTGSQAVSNGNTEIEPFVGITGTPVIDRSASVLYVVAASQTIQTEIGVPPTYSHWLYALDLATGNEGIQSPGVEIASLDSVFDSSVESQRAALLLDNGTVYIAFGSNGVPGDYHGWLFGYDSSSLKLTNDFDVTPNLVHGGIWQSGGGPSADSNHNVFVVTGDGPFDVDRGGMSYSDSFLRFGTADGLSKVADYFTPCDQAALEAAGEDVGASAPVLVLDSLSQPNLLIGGSKNGSLYILNPYNMGGILLNPCPNLTAPAQTIPLGAGPIMSTPLYWNNAVYVAPGNSNLMSFPMSAGMLASPPADVNLNETLGPQGSTPVISWNEASNLTGTAILWLIDTSGALVTPNTPAVLRAYDPNNHLNEIYNSELVTPPNGPAVKFTVPTVANGKVYVGTQSELDVYGLLQ
ncbi:MAG: hypothetical protein WCA19_22175 [Candidatus Acidiferrales bacterium]